MPDLAATFARLALAALAAAPAAAQPSAAAPAPDWERLSLSTAMVTLSWDRARVVRRGDVVEVVVRVVFNVGRAPKTGDFLTEIRCADRKARIIRTTNYSADGAPVAEDHPKAKFFKIKPNTYHEPIRAAVC